LFVRIGLEKLEIAKPPVLRSIEAGRTVQYAPQKPAGAHRGRQVVFAAAQVVIAAGARINYPVVLDAGLTDGHAQRLWIVKNDAGVDVMMCPQKPDANAIENLEAKTGRKVEVEEFFLTPTKLVLLIDRGLMTPLPNHNPDDPLAARRGGHTGSVNASSTAT
jgi:hypothetical protein